MVAWFEFFLTAVSSLVSTVFDLDLGIGFSLGDIEVALLVIGIVAAALVLKVQSTVGGAISENISSHNSKVSRSSRSDRGPKH